MPPPPTPTPALQLVDPDAGANCAAALQRAAPAAQHAPRLTRRFQLGSVDEVCFLAPDLGPLAGVLVGPEAGGWGCEEVMVASSRSGAAERFVCREMLGRGGVGEWAPSRL